MLYLTSQERKTIVFVLSLLILGIGLDFFKQKTGRANLINFPALEEKMFEKIDINKAGALEFATIPGVGEKLAEAIVEERKIKGDFEDIEDLKRVRGIKNKKLEQLKKYITNISFLSLAAVSFILGIILAESFNPGFKILYILALCVLAASVCLFRRAKSGYLIFLMFVLAGALRQVSFAVLYSDDIYYLSKHRLNGVYLTGRVISQVQEGPYDRSFVFSARSIRTDNFGSRVSGKVHVRFNKWIDLNYGDELAITGKLSDLKDTGYFNKRLIRQGIRSAMYVRRKDWIEIEDADNFSLQKAAFQIKEKLKWRFRDLPSPTKDILVAFILGDREGLSKELYTLFKYTGTVHVLPAQCTKLYPAALSGQVAL
jgi:competence ComEA-like helix-hairpin-helix protein